MAKIKYNVKGVDPGGDRTLPKAGIHRCKVISCVVAKPEGKDQRIEVQYQVQDDEPKGSKGYIIYDYINLERDDLDWKVAQFVAAMGLPESGSMDPEDQVGTGLNVRVKIQPESEQYAAKATAGTLLPLDGEGEDDEDLSEEADEDESGDDEIYTEEDLMLISKDALFEIAGEFEIETPKRLTAAGKTKLIAAILETQGGEDESEEEDDEDYEQEELEAMDEEELIEILEEFELDPDDYSTKKKVGKRVKVIFDEEAAIAAILDAQEESGDADDESEDEDEAPDYEEMSISDLKALAKERKLDVKGSKKVLITRLTKDDQPF